MLSLVREQADAVAYLSLVLGGTLVSPLLLTGPEGTGRRFAVRQLVQDMFCTGDGTSACPCIDCLQVRQGTHPDYTEVSGGDKDLGIDQVRDVLELTTSMPALARHRVFLIEGVDRMTTAAANAFLKTLEEPPGYTRFFLLAESAGAVIPTIQSRCGLVSFRPLSEGFILSKITPFEKDATKALVYARLAEGSVGRAIQYWGSGRLTLRDKAFSLLRLSVSKDIVGLFSLVDAHDKDLLLLLRFVDSLLCDLLMLSIVPDKLTNIDLVESLQGLKQGVSDNVWQALRCALRDTRDTYRKVKINLSFALKSILAETFAS